MSQPAISFIVPVYNVENYLTECVESILSQTVSKEIILIDDGSTDNSLNIALDYAKQYPFVTVIHHQNKGQSAARNLGINIAKGEYIFFVDSDDILLGDSLGTFCEMAHQQNVDMVKLQVCEAFTQDGQLYYSYISPALVLPKTQEASLVYGYQCFAAMTQKNIWMPGICWTLFRKSYLDKHQIRFLEGVRAEDQLFYIQCLTSDLQALLLEIPFVIYYYRRRENSTTTSLNNVGYLIDHFKIMAHLDDWEKQHNFPTEVINGLAFIKTRLLEMVKIKYQTSLEPEYQQQLVEYIARECPQYLT